MAYTKKTWVTSDAITDTALNNIENGLALIGNGFRSGTGGSVVSAATSVDETITFSPAFSTTPTVVLALGPGASTALEDCHVAVKTVSATQVVVTKRNTHPSSSRTVNFSWIAHGT